LTIGAGSRYLRGNRTSGNVYPPPFVAEAAPHTGHTTDSTVNLENVPPWGNQFARAPPPHRDRVGTDWVQEFAEAHPHKNKRPAF